MSDPIPLLKEVHVVAFQLRCSQETVRRYIRKGELPAVQLGAHWRIYQADVNTFLETKRQASLQRRIATKEAALDLELGIPPRGRDGPREVTRSPGRTSLAQDKKGA